MYAQQTQFNINSILTQMSSSYLNILTLILRFLDNQQLNTIAQIGLQSKKQSPFFRLALAKVFMNKYINRVDRGIFFSFYDAPDFQNIEQNLSSKLATHNYQFLSKSYQDFSAIFQKINDLTSFMASHQEFTMIVEEIFLAPDLPLPKMARQTIGMYCQSLFQQFMSRIRFASSHQQTFIEQALQQLQNSLEQDYQFFQMNPNFFQNQEAGNIIHTLRYRGFRIDHTNWPQFLIEQRFRSHNLIVMMLAICQQLAGTFQSLLLGIEDPMMQFVEFTLRSNVYRNIVLNFEQKFEFLLKNYNQIYNQVSNPPPSHPPFNFWRPALSIWMQHMNKFHLKNAQTFSYIMSKLRQISLLDFLLIKTQKLPSFYTKVKNQIEMRSFSEMKKQRVYEHSTVGCLVETFFDQDEQTYQILAKDYVDYMIDISMNEYNVHWCGHSMQAIRGYPTFRQFNQIVTYQTQQFYSFIMSILKESTPPEIMLNIYRQIIKQDINWLNLRLVKPVTLRNIVQMSNRIIQKQIENIQQYALFVQEGITKYKITFDFEQKNNLLAYFGAKAQITMDCPQDMSFYYNIQADKDATPQKSMDEESDNAEEMHLQQYQSDQAKSEHSQ